jgi:hypothetical protein
MILILLSPVQITAAGIDSPPELYDSAEMPLGPFDKYKDDI